MHEQDQILTQCIAQMYSSFDFIQEDGSTIKLDQAAKISKHPFFTATIKVCKSVSKKFYYRIIDSYLGLIFIRLESHCQDPSSTSFSELPSTCICVYFCIVYVCVYVCVYIHYHSICK